MKPLSLEIIFWYNKVTMEPTIDESCVEAAMA